MIYLHLLMAVLATWRITELFTGDRITEGLRKRFPTYLWQCPRCMSVWAGLYATIAFALFPWLNWPFALAWLYLIHNETIFTRRMTNKGRKMLIEVDPNGNVKWQNELSQQEVLQILGPLLNPQPPTHTNGVATPPGA